MNVRRVLIKSILAVFFSATSTMAQDDQFRLLLHPTIDITDHWFVPIWGIGTIKTQTSMSGTLLSGLGYRAENWWLEGMAQRFWSKRQGQWFLNFRYRKDLDRLGVYLEPTFF